MDMDISIHVYSMPDNDGTSGLSLFRHLRPSLPPYQPAHLAIGKHGYPFIVDYDMSGHGRDMPGIHADIDRTLRRMDDENNFYDSIFYITKI